jgi:hypothetical protein
VLLKDKNRFFCPSDGCETILKKKNKDRKTNGVKCPKCKQSYCPNCLQEAHGKKTCHEKRNQLLDNSNNKSRIIEQIAQCPKCKSIFEKVNNQIAMDCQVCGSEWCWICGVDIDSPIHYCMYVPCSLINFILPLVSIPIFFRVIMIIFTLIFGLPFCLIMYGFFMPFKFA